MVARYFCPECDETFSKFKHLRNHMKKSTHLPSICKDCAKVLITTREVSIHNDETGHGQYTGIVKGDNLRELQNLTRIDESTELDEKAQLFISIDAQSLCYNYDIVALTYILKQLNLFAEKIGLQPRFETIAPIWMVKSQKYNHNDKVTPYTRLITMFVPKTDKELDDYLVVALASTNEGYYLSNDKKMHEHIGKSDEWRDLHRISFRSIKETNEIQLIFPNGEISNQYNKLFEEGELKIEFEEWETTIRTETIEKEKRKEEKLPKKYVCPDCDDKFPKLNILRTHCLETGHASLICDDCDEIFAVMKHKDEHERKTGHSNYSGKIYKPNEMIIQAKAEAV